MANPYIGCFLSILSKSEMRYAGVLYRIDPRDAVIGLTNVRSFGTEGRRKDGSQVLPDNRVFDYVNFRGSDIKELQVLSSESQPEKITSDLPDDPAIIQAYFFHSSSASAITPQATTVSGPNSSLGLLDFAVHQNFSSYQPVRSLTSFSPLLSTNSLAAGQPMLLHGQEFGKSTGEVSYPQQQLLAGVPPGLAAYHIKQPMQYPAINPMTMGVAATYGLSDSFKPAVIMESLTSTPILIPFDLPSDPAILISSTFPYLSKDLLSSSMTSMSLAAKCPSTAGLNINTIPQVIHGANFVRGSWLAPESLPLATFSKNESGSRNHMEDLKPLPVTPSQILQTGPHPLSSSHFHGSAHEDKEVVKSLTSKSLPREPTGAQAPILPLPKPYATKVYKGNLRNHDFIASKSAKRGKRHNGASEDTKNHKAYGRGKGEKMRTSNVQNQRDTVSKVAYRIKRMTESRTNQNTSNLGKGGKKIEERADRQDHQTSKSILVGRGKKIPHLAAKYSEDFDFVAMNKRFNKDQVWGELGKRREAHLKTNASSCDLLVEGADHLDAAIKLDEKPGHVKDDFFDSLSTGPPGPRKPKISEQKKLDMETFGYFQSHQRSHVSRASRLGGNSNVFSDRKKKW